jgi:hypothetical protein
MKNKQPGCRYNVAPTIRRSQTIQQKTQIAAIKFDHKPEPTKMLREA